MHLGVFFTEYKSVTLDLFYWFHYPKNAIEKLNQNATTYCHSSMKFQVLSGKVLLNCVVTGRTFLLKSMRTNKSTVQGIKRNFTTICVVTSHHFSLLDRTGDLEIKKKTFYYKIIFLNRSIIEIFNFPASLLCYFIPCVCKN